MSNLNREFLESTTYGRLSQDDLTAASDKGWTITTT